MRFAGGLREKGIAPVLVTDAGWPEDGWQGGEIERLRTSSPDGISEELAAIRARHPGALLFSMERLPGADIFRAGDGLHSAWLERLGDEEPAWKRHFRRNRPMHRRILSLEKALFRDPELRVVANSRMVAGELGRVHGFDEERVAIIPNGFDVPDFPEEERWRRRAEVRARHGVGESETLFLFAGSGWKRKGVDFLLGAFAALESSGARLMVVGKGKLPWAVPPGVHFAGPVADPADYFLAADVFVLPTLYDPFSNACLEAACFGLPVITSDANGFAEVIDDHPGCGEVVGSPRSAARWTEALGRWLDPDRRAGAKASLAAIRRHFTVSRNVSATVAFIQQIHRPAFLP